MRKCDLWEGSGIVDRILRRPSPTRIAVFCDACNERGSDICGLPKRLYNLKPENGKVESNV